MGLPAEHVQAIRLAVRQRQHARRPDQSILQPDGHPAAVRRFRRCGTGILLDPPTVVAKAEPAWRLDRNPPAFDLDPAGRLGAQDVAHVLLHRAIAARHDGAILLPRPVDHPLGDVEADRLMLGRLQDRTGGFERLHHLEAERADRHVHRPRRQPAAEPHVALRAPDRNAREPVHHVTVDVFAKAPMQRKPVVLRDDAAIGALGPGGVGCRDIGERLGRLVAEELVRLSQLPYGFFQSASPFQRR